MIRVFVVDDEKLVRKGIVGLIDWNKYSMEVVGEADNGLCALEFLRGNEVDLLFTDLEMPGLAFMDFINTVRAEFPNISIVVLTMHQEFQLIQQALRAGVMDYITKTQIERENIDAIMVNILNSYAKRQSDNEQADYICMCNDIFVICTDDELSDQRSDSSSLTKALSVLQKANVPIYKAGSRDAVYSSDLSGDARAELSAVGGIFLLELAGADRRSFSSIAELTDKLMTDRVFYDYLPTVKKYFYDLEDRTLFKPTEFTKEELIAQAKDLLFIADNSYCAQTLEEISRLFLSRDERDAFFYQLNLHWAQISQDSGTKYFEEVGGFHWWYQWKEWVEKKREYMRGMLSEYDGAGNYAAEIQKAIMYIRENLSREIALSELLKITNMSKSLFSKEFKRITGDTFIGFLNDARIDAAKTTLETTDKPIYAIAELCGFTSERYFRKVFFERVNEKPKKYREKHMSEKK